MHIGGSHIKGVYHACGTAQGVEFVAIAVHLLRCAISPCWSRVRLPLSHCTPFRTCTLTNLYRLGINAEDKLTAVNSLSDGFTDVFAKQSRQFSALIVLPTSDEIGNGIGTLTVKTNKKIVPTVDTECLRCDGESYSLQKQRKWGSCHDEEHFPSR